MNSAAALTDMVSELGKTFAGQLLQPVDPGYNDARKVHNGLIDKRPALIARCRCVADIVDAVKLAREQKLEVAVRGGGHNVAGLSTIDGGLMIDLSPMTGIRVDPKARTACAQGGLTWSMVNRETQLHGLAVTGGVISTTGIAGLTLGGGIGWLLPVMGFTCDNLVEAEVVTADGSVVTAGPGGDADLLWALRGGGGNFGIVTRFTYRLRPVGPLFGGTITCPAAAAAAVHGRILEVLDRWPTACAPFIPIGRGEDGADEISVLLAVVDGTDGETIAAALRRDLPVKADDLGPRTYLELQAMSGILPFGLRHYWKGHFLRDLDRSTFEALVEAAASEDSVESSFVLLEAVTGAGLTEPDGGAAFGQRAARWNASAIAIWESPEVDEIAIGWSRRVADILAPVSLTGGGYVNYAPADETPDRVRAAYGREHWDRLVAVKRRLDPDNVFRFNHNIRPD
jgi:FAD/FMN-containing dehydrogenase